MGIKISSCKCTMGGASLSACKVVGVSCRGLGWSQPKKPTLTPLTWTRGSKRDSGGGHQPIQIPVWQKQVKCAGSLQRLGWLLVSYVVKMQGALKSRSQNSVHACYVANADNVCFSSLLPAVSNLSALLVSRWGHTEAGPVYDVLRKAGEADCSPSSSSPREARWFPLGGEQRPLWRWHNAAKIKVFFLLFL